MQTGNTMYTRELKQSSRVDVLSGRNEHLSQLQKQGGHCRNTRNCEVSNILWNMYREENV